jgi:hypothetical protein
MRARCQRRLDEDRPGPICASAEGVIGRESQAQRGRMMVATTVAVTEIGRFRKSATEEVRVTLEMFHGRQIVNVRVIWNKSEDEAIPLRKGIALATDKLPDLLALLVKTMHTVSPTAGPAE